MEKLKTLKDLRKGNLKVPYILMEAKIKAEAIKWVKEDKKDLDDEDFPYLDADHILERWMRRLNITSEDLEENNDN